ncbi:putative LRR receptor-like serine/threonine-protein kinase, partial [Mucuna pruriens]
MRGQSVTIGDKTYGLDKCQQSFLEMETIEDLDNNMQLPYITQNKTTLYMPDTELYKNAPISPISLTYYGFCLKNGNYKVKLHFVKIIFTDDNTYSSLGRRIFDIYIQLAQKDFNITSEGVGKEIIKPFDAYVSSNDLEIRFYWLEKGQLISHIKHFVSFDTNSSLCNKHNPQAAYLKELVVVAIVTKIIIGILCIVSILWWKGVLLNGTIIAVKQLSSKSKQGNCQFVNEIDIISVLQHPYLVKLYGCCVDGDQLLLVYEYMENNSLAYTLFSPEECLIKLDWPTRYKICVGIVREQFPYVIKHKQDKMNVVVDALLRRYALIAMLETKLLGLDYIKELYEKDLDFCEPFAMCVHGQKLYVSMSSIWQLLMMKAREGGLMGHFGELKTFDIFSEHFYWPHMMKKVHNICVKYLTCKLTKSRVSPHGLYTLIPIPTSP